MLAAEDTPKVLTYRFHDFRPSDRLALKEVALKPGGDKVFVAALEVYLKKWAAADWLTEYDLERIAYWTAIHLPDVARLTEETLDRRHSAAQNEQAKQTYAVMLEALRSKAPDSRCPEPDI